MDPSQSDQRVPVIPSRVSWRAYDGEVLVVTSSDACIRRLSEVGSFAFQRFDGCATLRGVAAAITEEFNVSEETALKDLKVFVEDLHRRGLITWAE